MDSSQHACITTSHYKFTILSEFIDGRKKTYSYFHIDGCCSLVFTSCFYEDVEVTWHVDGREARPRNDFHIVSTGQLRKLICPVGQQFTTIEAKHKKRTILSVINTNSQKIY